MISFRELNWPLVLIWAALSTIGLVAIYSATQGPVSAFLPSYIQENFLRQAAWVAISGVVIFAVQFVSPRTFQGLSFILYGLATLLMVITVFFGSEVSGSRSWLQIGPFNMQVAEFMKLATILAAANYLTNRRDISAENLKTALVTLLFFAVPVVLLILQNEAGVAVIFLGLLPFMLFWSGLPHGISLLMISPAIIGYFSVIHWQWGILATIIITICIFFIQRRNWISFTSLVLGLLTVVGTEVALKQVLQSHQAARIEAFVNPSVDPQGSGWNILQATTAIGSGGVTGKGFMEGTQTQLRFLPEQWTDFIFCVVSEEFGFVGAGIIMILFLMLFLRLLNMASSHKHPFAQLVIVSVAAVYFINFTINIASSLAIMPVIGLPLPFISYGGSAFLTNSLLLAICLNMDFYKRSFSIYS
ncbi:MAG: FtsW/RodA/SpoVE family cell cycle protein [Balneolaceae bacterium]